MKEMKTMKNKLSAVATFDERKERERKKFVDEIVAETEADFEKRRKIRLKTERQWLLNMNFVSGNQYCDINGRGEVVYEDKEFSWQNRRVFNHIAPIIEMRLSKFARVCPEVYVRPLSDDDEDVSQARIAEKLVASAFDKNNFHETVKKVTSWSEVCGTGFYKIVWNNSKGNVLGNLDGEEIKEGDVEILAVSPFEIYPDGLYTENPEDCESIIHAKAVSADVVKEKYGVAVNGKRLNVISLSTAETGSAFGEDEDRMENGVIVIEKYERPTKEYPNGRLITVADGKLLYYGELPYRNGCEGKRSYPFIKQVSVGSAGSFFGVSIVERLIPVQRAYNAVKNRKHEFLNRLSTGIMTVEDGSVDTEDLAEEGLSPGKVLVYRQGSKPPEVMSETTIPPDFNTEEDRLLNEFVIISGVSDVSSSSQNASVSSGTALELLVEQDNQRLSLCAEEIRQNYLAVAKRVLRLYSQFIRGLKAFRYGNAFGKTEIGYANRNTALSDDVYLESENELMYTPTQKKDMIFRLYDSGLLSDDEGQIRPAVKEKILSLLGYKDLDYKHGISSMQEEKARNENPILKQERLPIEEIDDDEIHIDEHTRYVLSEYEQLSAEEKQRLFEHVAKHRERKNQRENQSGKKGNEPSPAKDTEENKTINETSPTKSTEVTKNTNDTTADKTAEETKNIKKIKKAEQSA